MANVTITDNLHDKLMQYIIDNNFINPGEIRNDTLIFQEGLLDSMGFVSLISFLEEEFGILPVDDDLVEENFESVNAIVRYIEGAKVNQVG